MNKCIYCDENKPFTDEHVVCAGLGGDDKNWLLKDCVCGDCNTKVFSKLEAAFLRSSPVAIARLFNQEKTRGHSPSLNTSQSLLEDPRQGVFLNQELQQGFKPVILPQIVLKTAGTLLAYSPNVEAWREFQSVLQRATSSAPILLRKVNIKPEVRFERTWLTWDAEREDFTVSRFETTATSPKQTDGVVWVEELVMPPTAGSACKLTPCVYRRSKGELVCAVVNIDDVTRVLTHLRRNGCILTVPDDAVSTEVVDYGVHLTFKMPVDVHDRVMTKIAINLVAHQFGPEFVRRPEFAAAKNYALTKTGRILKINSEKHRWNRIGMSGLLPGTHMFCIAAANSGNDDTRLLSVMASLYEGPLESFAVAELPKGAPELKEPIVVFVFYNENRIERLSMNELQQLTESEAKLHRLTKVGCKIHRCGLKCGACATPAIQTA